ncbi:hypothetical protein Daus18300_013260 [Diaporthe australafricana]|uniref:Uncharacterized protein n=1 Tax=Diaporthe australafricana TaxID=127596 RepID=A0ABR3VZR1_9PEZI
MEAPLSSPTQRNHTAASHWPQAATKGYAAPVAAPRQQQKQQSSAPPSTDAFLKDFTLVAEAAKRAQVAVMFHRAPEVWGAS